MRASRYPRHSDRRPPSLSASRGSAPPYLSTSSGPGSLAAPPMDAAFSSLFYLFALSACACRFEVIVTSVSLPPFVSRRGLLNTTNVSLYLQRPNLSIHCTPSPSRCFATHVFRYSPHRPLCRTELHAKCRDTHESSLCLCLSVCLSVRLSVCLSSPESWRVWLSSF